MNIFNELKIRSVLELADAFPNEKTCLDFLEKIFWDGNPVSPFDKNSKVYKCKGNKYKCKNTGKYFTIRNIGIFKNSNLKLRKWFAAIWLFTSHKGGLSSMQLQRELNVTQKTTWFILKRLRECSKFENNHVLSGEVEIDETYVGGKNKNRHADKKVRHSQGRSFKDKTPVLGLIQRGGKVVARVVPTVSREDLEPFIFRTVNLHDTVFTDEWKAYNGLKKFYDHSIVNHGKKEYVNGNASTNCIENFWTRVKGAIIGVYRVTSKKHLQLYMNEFVFKHNTRQMSPSERFMHLISNIKGCNLSYEKLTAK